MPNLPPWSQFARLLPASSTIVILSPTPRTNHIISYDTLPFVKWSAKLDSQSTLLLVFPKPLLDAVALAALESVHVLTRGLSPRSDSNNCIPSPSAVTVTMPQYSDFATLQARDARVLDQRFTTVPLSSFLHLSTSSPRPFAQFESTWTSISHLIILVIFRLSLRPCQRRKSPKRKLCAIVAKTPSFQHANSGKSPTCLPSIAKRRWSPIRPSLPSLTSSCL